MAIFKRGTLKVVTPEPSEPAKPPIIGPDEPKAPVVTVYPPPVISPATGKGPYQVIDLSHYEPAADWAALKKAGVCGLYTKATEGLSAKDAMLKVHVAGAQGVGLPATAYHFFHASLDGRKQAQFFLETCKGMTFDWPCILDWEESSGDRESSAKQQIEALAWLEVVEAATGRTPWIYTGDTYMADLNVGTVFAKYPIIAARYSQSPARIPKPWTKLLGWQFTDSKVLPGLKPGHACDDNWIECTAEEFAALVKPYKIEA